MADYIQKSDPGFHNWQATVLIPYITANRVALGVSTGTLTGLTDSQAVWTPAYSAHQLAQSTALSKAQDKDDAKTAYTALIRASSATFRREFWR